jgi:hypothetical protein
MRFHPFHRPRTRLPGLFLLAVVAAGAAAPRSQAQELVWDVSRQCWRAAEGATCGQSYNVGTQHYEGEATTRPTTTSPGKDGIPTGGESGDRLRPDPAGNASVQTLEQVRERAAQLKDLGETSGDLLQRLGILSGRETAVTGEDGS